MKSGIGFKRLNRILITHGHLDHILGLGGLISTLARWETMALVRRFLKQAVVESAIAEHSGIVSREHQQTIEREAEELLKRMPWGQLEMRLFEQGGWVHKDSQQRVMYVTLKPFRNPLLQRACELLCEHLNQHQPVVRCQDGECTLRYACRASPLP